MPIAYRTGDYRDLGRFDFVISSLVAHHMTDRQLRDFLRWMEANSDGGWFVNDLHRHRFAYFGFPLLAALLRVHRIVREDGQLSIARSFRPADWRSILAEPALADGRPDPPLFPVPAVRRTAALIVGGGPAGSAAAIALGARRRGSRADRADRGPARHGLRRLPRLGRARRARTARARPGGARRAADPPASADLGETARSKCALPRLAAGLSRRTLDEALLAAARRAGAEVGRGRTVRAADLAERRVRLDDEEEKAGEALILATGKHELRGAARPVDTSTRPLGLRSALEAGPGPRRSARRRDRASSLRRRLCRPSAAGGRPGQSLPLGVARPAEGGRRDRAAGRPAGRRASRFRRAARARGARPRWSAVSGVPYGWRAGATVDGVYRVGDQAAVIASLAGDGIAIALESGLAAARRDRGREGGGGFPAGLGSAGASAGRAGGGAPAFGGESDGPAGDDGAAGLVPVAGAAGGEADEDRLGIHPQYCLR